MRPIIWSYQARDDLIDIADYISEDNPAAARRVTDAIEAAAAALSDMPTGRPGRVKGTYEKVIVGLPYILAYAFHHQPDGNEVVYLLRIIHGARKWKPDEWPK